MRILVTDPHTRTALAAVRSLAQFAEVQVAGVRRRSIAAASRYVRYAHIVPDPHIDIPGYVETIRKIARDQQIDVILPVTDGACRVLLGQRAQLAPSVVVGPSLEAFLALSDKAGTAKLAEEYGIPVPAGGMAESREQAEALARELGLPVVLKPVESVAVDPHGRVRRSQVVRVDRSVDVISAWDAAGSDRVLVQSYVSGWGEGLFLLRWGGTTWASCAHRRLREKPPAGGVSTLRESIPLDPIELARVERVLDALRFEGVAMAEFRTDGRRRWLMEFNARLWGSVQLAIDSGIDFPRMFVEAAIGHPRPPVPAPLVGLRSRWLLGDLDHALMLARGCRDSAGRTGMAAALRVLGSRTGPNSRFEILRANDLAPFFREAVEWLAAVARLRR